MTDVLLTASEELNAGMHSDIFRAIWFELSTMIGTTEFDILIPVYLTFITTVTGV